MTQNFYLRCVFFVVTLGLFWGLYVSHHIFSAAETALNRTQAKHQKVQKEHQHWADLKRKQTRLVKEVDLENKIFESAFHSFGRIELHAARAKVMSNAKLAKAAIFPDGDRGSVWIPEAGHKITFFFEIENLPEGEELEWAADLPQRLDFELMPNKLYSFRYWATWPEYKKTESFLRFKFDNEMRFDITRPTPSTGTSYPGIGQSKTFQPGVLNYTPYQFYLGDTGPEHLRDGAWHFFQTISCLFRPAGGKSDQVDSSKKPLKITCRPVIFGPTTAYTEMRHVQLLKKQKVGTTEIVDPQSPWHGWAKINPDPIE